MPRKQSKNSSNSFVFVILLCLSLFVMYIVYTKKNCPSCDCKRKDVDV